MKDILEKTIEIAIAKGANQAEVILIKGDSISAKTSDLKLDDYSVNSSQIIGLRVITNQREGISFCESSEVKTLEIMTEQAITNSLSTFQDENISIEVKRIETINGSKKEYNENRTEPKTIIEMSLDLNKKIKAIDKRAKAPNSIVSESFKEKHLLNHLGTYCLQKEKNVYGFSNIILEDGAKKSTYMHYEQSTDFDDVKFELIAGAAHKHALGLLNGRSLKTGFYNICFTSDTLHSLLLTFSNIFSGESTIKKLNPLKDKLNEKIAHKNLTIMDIPKMSEANIYNLFDSEGNESKELVLIENGILKNFYQNSYTSKLLNMKNTYHGYRNPKGKLGVSGNNWVIDKGFSTEKDINKETYFEIIKIQGLNSGHNSMTGDFSFAASGYLISKGEIIQAVKGVTISDNYFSLLNKISIIGNQIAPSNSKTFFSPRIIFADVQVGGD